MSTTTYRNNSLSTSTSVLMMELTHLKELVLSLALSSTTVTLWWFIGETSHLKPWALSAIRLWCLSWIYASIQLMQTVIPDLSLLIMRPVSLLLVAFKCTLQEISSVERALLLTTELRMLLHGFRSSVWSLRTITSTIMLSSTSTSPRNLQT